MSAMNRMSRVITFRMPSAPGWKVQFNMNDQHFTLFYWKEVKDRWQLEPEANWRCQRRDLELNEIESEAERRLQLESEALEYERRADDADFTDLYPTY